MASLFQERRRTSSLTTRKTWSKVRMGRPSLHLVICLSLPIVILPIWARERVSSYNLRSVARTQSIPAYNLFLCDIFLGFATRGRCGSVFAIVTAFSQYVHFNSTLRQSWHAGETNRRQRDEIPLVSSPVISLPGPSAPGVPFGKPHCRPRGRDFALRAKSPPRE